MSLTSAGDFWKKFFENLVIGGSFFFVFISGFLFHHVFYHKFEYGSFLRKKFANVVLPYLFLGGSLDFLRVYVFMDHQLDYDSLFLWGRWLISGNFMLAYWYIPFVFCIYLLSPFFISYIESRFRVQLSWLVFFVLVSLFVHRPEAANTYEVAVLHNLLYFSSVYLLGIAVALYRKELFSFLAGRELWFLAAGLCAAAIETFNGKSGNYSKDIWAYEGVDWQYVQKFFLCFFYLSLFKKYARPDWFLLNKVATTSFGIFFIHPILLMLLLKLPFDQDFYRLNGIGSVFIVAFLVLGASMGIALLIKKFIPRYSRNLIGY